MINIEDAVYDHVKKHEHQRKIQRSKKSSRAN